MFVAQVDHVVLFDFPKTPGELIRRIGRTGRSGRSGRVTILAYGRQATLQLEILLVKTCDHFVVLFMPGLASQENH
jgi:superfamily II DNA/RNA helicase